MEWTPEGEEALQSLKRYLASPPVLVDLAEKEPSLLYIPTWATLAGQSSCKQGEEPTDALTASQADNQPGTRHL